MTVWITADAKKAWCHRGRRKPGGKRVYSDVAIETFWMISMIYGLALRQTEGFIESLFELAGVTLPVPDHSTVSRRVRKLGKVPMMPRGSKGPIHLLVDSSGLKIHVGGACGSPKPRHRQKFAVSGCWMKAEMRDSPCPSPLAISASRYRHGEAGPRIDPCLWLGAEPGIARLSPQAARRV